MIRRATPEDLEAIARIQAGCPEAAQWPPGDYLRCDCRVAELDGRVAGFAVFRRLGPGEAEILNLAVDPDCRRRGVASDLLRGTLPDFPGRVFLEVRRSNPAAQRLYELFGFQITGVRPQYYSEPIETAVVMTLQS
ncbi:MAG: GNAT family N-acetyltransferase [Bryobacteraceae bacterium]